MQTQSRWTVVIPVKPLHDAKSRLVDVPPSTRAELALAFAQDVVSAAIATLGVGKVVVVSGDPRVNQELGRFGAVCVDEPPQHWGSPGGVESVDSLNAAVNHGVTAAGFVTPDFHIAVIAADLPSLRPTELQYVLSAAQNHDRGFVADHLGRGTSVLTVGPRVLPEPQFGYDSARLHAESGATDLTEFAGPSVRMDVDTADDLTLATGLGLGAATAARLGLHVHVINLADQYADNA